MVLFGDDRINSYPAPLSRQPLFLNGKNFNWMMGIHQTFSGTENGWKLPNIHPSIHPSIQQICLAFRFQVCDKVCYSTAFTTHFCRSVPSSPARMYVCEGKVHPPSHIIHGINSQLVVWLGGFGARWCGFRIGFPYERDCY